jgi:excisionase family DNA binding protein
MKPDPGQESLLTLSETARRLSVSVRTLTRWVTHGRFPSPLRFGHPSRPRIRFRASDIERFLAREEVSHAR